MADDSEVAMVHRNKRLAENITAGRSPLDDDNIRLMRINGAAMIDAPGPRVVQLIELLDVARARVAALEAELAKVKGHRTELSERCYRKDLELDELRERADR